MGRSVLGGLFFLALAAPAESAPPTRTCRAEITAVGRGDSAFECGPTRTTGEQTSDLDASPFSVSPPALTSQGARGETFVHPQRSLHLPAPVRLGLATNRLAKRNRNVKGIEFRLANALWGQPRNRFPPAVRVPLDNPEEGRNGGTFVVARFSEFVSVFRAGHPFVVRPEANRSGSDPFLGRPPDPVPMK